MNICKQASRLRPFLVFRGSHCTVRLVECRVAREVGRDRNPLASDWKRKRRAHLPKFALSADHVIDIRMHSDEYSDQS